MIRLEREVKLAMLKAIRDGEVDDDEWIALKRKMNIDIGIGEWIDVEVIESRSCVGCDRMREHQKSGKS